MPLLPILLAVAARDLFLPVAGRIRDPLHDIRTSVTLRNTSAAEAHATVRFVPAAGTQAPPRSLDVVIAPNAIRSVDPFGDDQALGAIRITSDQPLLANGRIVTPASSASFEALSPDDAITVGDAATLDGFTFTHAASETNRLYIIETAGDALQYTVIVRDAGGKVLAQNLHLIHPFEQHSLDLDHDFPSLASQNASVLLRGLNGGGRIAAAAAITKRASGEIVAREMQVTKRRERSLSRTETAAYAAIALFIIGAALRRRT
ncbi:MAG TPA: hypothetical protein VH087_17965 [Thermoanaerobaculia bacterium]|jgi:hypothetical protein|nr:hypothetical protein [Thermoanaerobaculia bacterium]